MRDDLAGRAQPAGEGMERHRNRIPERLLILLIVFLVAYAFAV